jgi:hypothetical protein
VHVFLRFLVYMDEIRMFFDIRKPKFIDFSTRLSPQSLHDRIFFHLICFAAGGTKFKKFMKVGHGYRDFIRFKVQCGCFERSLNII